MKSQQSLKLILAAILALFVAAKVPAQNPDLFFEQLLPYPNPYPELHDQCSWALEVAPDDGSEGYCMIAVYDGKRSCYTYETETTYKPLVYKVSQQGELLGELAFGFENRYVIVSGLYQLPDEPQCFLVVGTVHDNELHYDRPFMAKFDRDLNLLWQRETELPEPYRKYLGLRSVMDDEGRIFCSSYLFECEENDNTTNFFFRMTPEGELDGILDSPLVSEHKRPFVFPDGSGDYGSLECEKENQYRLTLLRINQDMDLIGQQVVPDEYRELDPIYYYSSVYFYLSPTPSPFVVPLPDSSLILANDAYLLLQDLSHQDNYYGAGFLWVEGAGDAVSYAMDTLVPELGNDSLRYMKGVSLADDDTFYFVYNMGPPGGWGYDWTSCFVVGRMTLDGDLLWRRYWNRYHPEYGMKVYSPTDFIVTHDEGCLITGVCYESDVNAPDTSTNESIVFLMKFFADGTLSVPLAEAGVRPYAIYPNPVDDILHLECSPDVIPRRVEVYDIQGRLLRVQTDSLESVNMENLPNGAYSLRVTMDDGTTYSEKVLKQ